MTGRNDLTDFTDLCVKLADPLSTLIANFANEISDENRKVILKERDKFLEAFTNYFKRYER